MSKFNKNPLKNLHHVKAVEPPKTGRAGRRAAGDRQPQIPLSEMQARFGAEFEARLQSIAIDPGDPRGDTTAVTTLTTLDSMAQMVRAEIQRRVREPDTATARMEQRRRIEAMIAEMARNSTPSFFLREEDRMAFGLPAERRPGPTVNASDFIISTPRRNGANAAHMLREMRQEGRDAIREINIDMESLDFNSEHLRSALGQMGTTTRRVAESLQQMGRTLRNFPIQAEIASMMQRAADAGYMFDPRRVEVTEQDLRAAADRLAETISMPASSMSFAEAIHRAHAKREAEVKKPPHPDAGKVINRPRRSVEGIMVEDVRNADGSITRRPRTKE